MISAELKNQRLKIIDEILADLYLLKKSDNNNYAIDENTAFFKAIKSKIGYTKWLFLKAFKIDSSKLLEFTDFAIPKWDRRMHQALVKLEKRKFPGLIKPLVSRISSIIISNTKNTLVADFGSGGIEVVRQVIVQLLNNHYGNAVTFVGVDNSNSAHEVAMENLKELTEKGVVDILKVEKLDQESLNDIIRKNRKQYKVILCKNNLFKISDCFYSRVFDIVFHSLFKHHFNKRDKEKLDGIGKQLGRIYLEYDGYKSWPHILVPHTLTGWKDPVFLNATIFSDLRYFTKKELKNNIKNGKINFYSIGTYLLES